MVAGARIHALPRLGHQPEFIPVVVGPCFSQRAERAHAFGRPELARARRAGASGQRSGPALGSRRRAATGDGTGRREEARRLSDRLSAVVKEVFARVAGLPDGNAFANANKAMDHFFAHGRQADQVAPPRLHAGSRLPVSLIHAAGETLQRHAFMPRRGYLE